MLESTVLIMKSRLYIHSLSYNSEASLLRDEGDFPISWGPVVYYGVDRWRRCDPCTSSSQLELGTGAKGSPGSQSGPRFEFSGNCESKRTSEAHVDTCSLSSCVHTRTSAGDKLPPVGRRRCLRSADDEGRLTNSAKQIF
jgi:hypothetical protein